MNTSNVILIGRSSNRHLGRALRAIAVVAVIALVCVLSSAAFGANPAEEMAKAGATGGIDPKGNSWMSIQKSIEQFAHPAFILRLFLSLSLAVGCAFAIAWHPRRAHSGIRFATSRSARRSFSLAWSARLSLN